MDKMKHKTKVRAFKEILKQAKKENTMSKEEKKVVKRFQQFRDRIIEQHEQYQAKVVYKWLVEQGWNGYDIEQAKEMMKDHIIVCDLRNGVVEVRPKDDIHESNYVIY